VWLTGLPDSGKSTIAGELFPLLRQRGWRPVVLDQEDLERHLDRDLRSGADRPSALSRQVAFIADILVRNGLVPIVAVWSPLAATRARARLRIRQFVEVYITTPSRVCRLRHDEESDPRSVAGTPGKSVDIAEGQFEAPGTPDITVGTLDRTPRQSAEWVVRELDRIGWTESLNAGAWSYTPSPTVPDSVPVRVPHLPAVPPRTSRPKVRSPR